MARLFISLLLACLLFINTERSAFLNAQPKPIAITVSPRVQLARLHEFATVTVLVTVPRSPQNRAIRVEVDGPTFRAWTEENVNLWATSQGKWVVKSLSAGEYEARAGLWRVEGEKGQQKVRQYFDVTTFDIRE